MKIDWEHKKVSHSRFFFSVISKCNRVVSHVYLLRSQLKKKWKQLNGRDQGHVTCRSTSRYVRQSVLYDLRPKKICGFRVSRPTLFFPADPREFFCLLTKKHFFLIDSVEASD